MSRPAPGARLAAALRDRIQDPNVFRIYWTTFGLGAAYGMAISVIAVFLESRGYDESAIGSLAAWFAGGILAGALPAGALIRRFSAKTTLVLGLFAYALTVTAFPFARSYAEIAGLRFFDGIASVCVWVSSETILLARADRRNKAFVTSLYAMAIAVGYITGPALPWAASKVLPLPQVFLLAGGLSVATALYAASRIAPSRGGEGSHEGAASGDGPVEAPAPFLQLLARIKTSCFATFAYGYFQSSVVLFLPLFLKNAKGIPAENTFVIPAFFAAGMLLCTNAAGRLGDRLGHLQVMRWLAVVGSATIAAFVWLDAFSAMACAVAVAGGSLASISPLSLALQGHVTREYGRATSVYNAFYAAGMLLGPPISGHLYGVHGGEVMLYHLAALWVAFVAFAAVFRLDDPAARAAVTQRRVTVSA